MNQHLHNNTAEEGILRAQATKVDTHRAQTPGVRMNGAQTPGVRVNWAHTPVAENEWGTNNWGGHIYAT